MNQTTFYRRMPRFDYHKPGSLEEATDLLSGNGDLRFRIYAGGTDVIPRLKSRSIAAPDVLVDLKGIPGLDYVVYDEQEGLRIGALATVYSVAHSPIVKERFGILSQAAGSIAAIQIQNRATIAGNICAAVPCADSAPALLCLEARLSLVSSIGERTIDIDRFFTGPSTIASKQDEILKEIQIPDMPENGRGVYLKLSPRRSMDVSIVGVGAVVSVRDAVFEHVRIALGSVASTPMRARAAEAVLEGQAVSEHSIMPAARAAAEESRPIDDHRASAEYRRMMVEVLVKRAIHRALSDSCIEGTSQPWASA